MKLKSINFNDDEAPESVTVEISTMEAAFVVRVVGRMNDEAANAVMKDGAEHLHEVYSCLSGSFFNRIYEGGVDDVAPKVQP